MDFGQSSNNEEFETDIWYSKLERLATQRAASSAELADLEKAATAAKLFADARKTRHELDYLNSHVRLEDAKSWAFLAIPIVMLVALFVFAPGPDQQARALRDANADTQWHEVERTFISQLNLPSSGKLDVVLLTTPLTPFLNDSRHGKEAMDLSLLALSRVTSWDTFQDFFVTRNIRVNQQNLYSILALDRLLYTTFNELDDALNTEGSNINAIPGRSLNKEQGQRARDAALLELTFLSSRMGAYFRGLNGAPLNSDLRRVFLKNVDLSGIDFGRSSIDNAQWEGVSLVGADLSSIQDFDNSQWIDASWWEARRISKPLLAYLIANQYPYHPPVTDYTNAPKSKDAYLTKVYALCDMVALACPPNKVPFGSATPSKTTAAGRNAPPPAEQ